MKKKRYHIDLNEEAYNNFIKKQKILSDMANKKINFQETLKFFSQKPIFVYHDEIKNFVEQNKKRRKRFLV